MQDAYRGSAAGSSTFGCGNAGRETHVVANVQTQTGDWLKRTPRAAFPPTAVDNALLDMVTRRENDIVVNSGHCQFSRGQRQEGASQQGAHGSSCTSSESGSPVNASPPLLVQF